MVKDTAPRTPKTGNVAAAKKRSLSLLRGALKDSKKSLSESRKKQRKGNGKLNRQEPQDKGPSWTGREVDSDSVGAVERTRVNLSEFSFGALLPETKTFIELQAIVMDHHQLQHHLKDH